MAHDQGDGDAVLPVAGHDNKASVTQVDRRSEDIEQSKAIHPERIDRELAKYASTARIAISPERSNELRRKIDKRVLLVMVTTYFLQAIDKGTMSFASIMGIVKDTGIANPDGSPSDKYPWLTTCIYIAILFVEYPQNFIISRVPIAKYLSFSIIAWGTVLACHAACKSFASLLVVRTLLGIFEAACQPCFLLLSSIWYRREEQAERVTYWYMMNGMQQIVGGLLAYCFSLIKTGPLKSWQWLFLSYGIASIFFGLFVLIWMPDSPMRAKCFTEQEKHEMVERVRDNQTGIQNRKFKKEQVIEALTDPQTWGYGLIAFTTTLPTSGLGAFANIIINSFGFTVLQTQLLSMVLGVYIILILLSSTWLVKKTGQNCLVMFFYCIRKCFVGTILLMTLPNHTKAQHVGLLICYYITISFWSAQTLSLSMISRNVAGQTKKSVVVATNFILWATGNAIGPQVFRGKDKPRYFPAFATHLACYSVLVVIILALRFHLKRQNKRRDELAAQGNTAANDEELLRAWEDLTDKENLSFRYVY